MKIILSRANAEANVDKEPRYYNYKCYQIITGKIEKYKIKRSIGRGRYSEVFEGKQNDKKIVIKVLKHLPPEKLNREILILKNLNHPSVIKIKDVVMDKTSGIYSLIFDWVKYLDVMKTIETATPKLIKSLMKQLIDALKYVHSRGIIHRDIKPQNMLITADKKLILIDWGLAEFYHPRRKYATQVASLYYKSPEILVEYPYYDYSMDIWAAGCIFAEAIFKKKPFFCGRNNEDQLNKIVNVLGSIDLEAYIEKYEIPYSLNSMVCRKRRNLYGLLKCGDKEELSEGIDLLEKMLVYDHNERFTAEECANHSYFNE